MKYGRFEKNTAQDVTITLRSMYAFNPGTWKDMQQIETIAFSTPLYADNIKYHDPRSAGARGRAFCSWLRARGRTEKIYQEDIRKYLGFPVVGNKSGAAKRVYWTPDQFDEITCKLSQKGYTILMPIAKVEDLRKEAVLAINEEDDPTETFDKENLRELAMRLLIFRKCCEKGENVHTTIRLGGLTKSVSFQHSNLEEDDYVKIAARLLDYSASMTPDKSRTAFAFDNAFFNETPPEKS